MKRIFKKLLLVAAGLFIALALLATGYILFGPWYAAELEIGPETTVVDGPLHEDGTVDYAAAMNEMAGQGMPPEENAFVIVVELIEPEAWRARGESERTRRKVFQVLDAPMPGDDAEYFVSIGSYAERRAEEDDRWTEAEDDDEDAVWARQWERAQERPWSAEDVPLVVEWLAAQESALARLSEGVQRPGYFMPYVMGDDDDLLPSPLPGNIGSLRTERELVRAVQAQAMRRLAGDDVDGAIADVLTIKRLGWHRRQSLMLLEQLVGTDLVSLTADGVAAIVSHEALTAEQARQLAQTLAEAEERFPLSRAIDVGERFVWLDIFQIGLRGRSVSIPEASVWEELAWSAPFSWAVNPNQLMREANAYYDRLVEAVQAETRAERMKQWEAVVSEAGARAADKSQGARPFFFLLADPRGRDG